MYEKPQRADDSGRSAPDGMVNGPVRCDPSRVSEVGVAGNFGRYPEARIAHGPYVVSWVFTDQAGWHRGRYLSSPYQRIWM